MRGIDRARRVVAAVFVAVALAGCATSRPALAPVPIVPALPGNLSAPCPVPDVRAGSPYLDELGRQRQALITCAHRHRDEVALWQDLRRRRGKR